MKDKIKRKFRSNQGATLLLSLLLFLVCVVAGNVALTAGTASSGTLSERAKLDQRYFSVTSAAELIREKFDGKSVSVTVAGTNINATIERPGEADGIDRDHANTEEKFVIDQSLYLLDNFVAPKIPWQAPYDGIINSETAKRPTPPAPPVSDKYTLTMTVDGAEIDSLKTIVTVNFTPSGLTFQLENANGDTEKFRLQMEYSAVILEEASADMTTYRINWKIGTIRYAN